MLQPHAATYGGRSRADAEILALMHKQLGGVYDVTTGQALRPELVAEARRQEMEYFTSKRVWEKRPIQEAFDRMGRPPISVKWVDTNMGDDTDPNYRSRLVAREIRRKGQEATFAPTPPPESLRAVLSLTATEEYWPAESWTMSHDSPQRRQVSLIDISKAYFNARTKEDSAVYVALPPEDPDHGKGLCGKLLVHMYGTRRAADGWHSESSEAPERIGFVRGESSACVFWHLQRRIISSVHGDDFTSAGSKESLDWFKKALEEHYELKEAARLGPGPNEDKEGRVLNRVVRWGPEGLSYEADPRHAEDFIKELGLETEPGSAPVKGVVTPCVKPTPEQLNSDKPLPAHKVGHFRGLAARANYLAADRPDIQYAAKEVCRWMAEPTELAVVALKRIARYLIHKPRLVYRYPWQQACAGEVYSDTDWAGCARTRKSTSGGCLMIGRHLIKSWSSTRTTISLSSGKAELMGVTKAAAVALGFRSLLADFGVAWPVRIYTDSTASIGMCSRQGLGKVRHLDIQIMWIQQRIRNGDLDLYKVLGDDNPADVLTKAGISKERMAKMLESLGCYFEEGRAASAPQLRTEGGNKAFAVTLGPGGRQRRQPRGPKPLLAGQADSPHPCSPATSRGPSSPLATVAAAIGSDERAIVGGAAGARARWADVAEEESADEAEGLTSEQLQRNAADLGLRTDDWRLDLEPGQRLVPPEPRLETEEQPDALAEHGERLGRAGRGREPVRLRQRRRLGEGAHRERSSHADLRSQ